MSGDEFVPPGPDVPSGPNAPETNPPPRSSDSRESSPPVIPVFHIGDVVETRRAHPCGGTTWEIYRVGMDIGIRCTRCGRRVLVPRRRFERRVRRFVSRPEGGGGPIRP